MSAAGEAGRCGLWLLLTCAVLLSAAAGTPAAGTPRAGTPGEAGRLPEPGTTLERELAGGQSHRFELQRDPDEELWISVDQDGVDVVVSVVSAAGEALLTVDSPASRWGEEWLLVRDGEPPTAAALEIRPFADHAAPGVYRLRVESRLPAEPADPRRRAAERAVTEAGRLYAAGTPETRRQALDRYREALAAWQALGREATPSLRAGARTLFLIGMLHRRLDELREALAVLRRALAGWRSLDDRRGEAQTLMEIGTTARMLGETELVEGVYLQALDVWRDLGDLHGQALTFNYLGLARARSDPQSAVEPYEEALALFRRIGDEPQEGVVLNNLGGVHDLLGEPHPALVRFRQALDIHERLGNLRQEAAVWNNVASIHRRTGRFQDALEGFQASLDARRELGDRRGEARVLNNLGMTWLALGDAARARDVLREALDLRREVEDFRGESFTLYNLGLVDAELDEWDQALERWSEALELHRTLHDRRGEATTQVAMGRAAGRLGQPGKARRQLQDALEILEEIGNPWHQARALRTLGEVETDAAAPEAAVTPLERSVELYRATGDEPGEGEALLALARAERAGAATAAGDRLAAALAGTAWAHATRALDVLESVRADVDSLGLRTSFLSRHGEAFEFAIDLAMELHRREPTAGWDAAALEISERARARSLLDRLQETGAGLRRGVGAALLERQQQLLERLNAKVDRYRRVLDRQGPSAESRRLAAETSEALARLDEVESQIRRQSPAWDALAHPRPLGADAIRSLLDPQTTLLEYSLGEERSFLWAVTAERIESFELPGRRVIEAAAREVYDRLRVQDPRTRQAEAVAAARLSEILLAPVAHRLAGRRVAVVPDGALHYLPFAALPDPSATSQPLLVGHEIVTLPSASALGVQRQVLAGRRPAAKALAVLADPVFGAPDPRLPGSGSAAEPLTLAALDPTYRGARSSDLRLERLGWSAWEAQTIAAHAGEEQATTALGFDADLDAVRGGRLSDYRVVHFATHGLVESEHPELSALVLSLYDAEGRPRDGLLRLPEIYNLDLGAELVVLSGCRTALGREIRGEGLVGLTRGFFAAGARRLVASLWRVQDRSAAELMDRFYRRLLRGGDGGPESPAAALREAQLELLREPELRDPYHWAAFAVYGDWR